MTNQEFSDSFTTLLNSYNTQAQFGEQASKREIVLDEYEKSVLLTQAQDIVVKSYFDARANSVGEGFDDSSRRQIDFSSLITVADCTNTLSGKKFDERGIMFSLPRKKNSQGQEIVGTTTVLFVLNEKLIYTKNGKKQEFVIVPISYKEYDREMSRPYAQPLKKQAWRLFQNNSDDFDLYTELIPREGISNVGASLIYRIRYVRRPKPIILEDLPNDLEIDGEQEESSCELNPILHVDILNKAVELAITTRGAAPQPQQRERNQQQ